MKARNEQIAYETMSVEASLFSISQKTKKIQNWIKTHQHIMHEIEDEKQEERFKETSRFRYQSKAEEHREEDWK